MFVYRLLEIIVLSLVVSFAVNIASARYISGGWKRAVPALLVVAIGCLAYAGLGPSGPDAPLPLASIGVVALIMLYVTFAVAVLVWSRRNRDADDESR